MEPNSNISLICLPSNKLEKVNNYFIKKKYIITISIIFVLIIFSIILLSKDFIMRQYFIHKLENHNFDEYILHFSINNKKTSISYHTPNFIMERQYDKNENLYDEIDIYEYTTNLQHHYNFKSNELFTKTYEYTYTRPTNINNAILLNFLNNSNEDEQNEFSYKFIKNINNRECHVLEFKYYNKTITTIYLDRKLLYTVRLDSHIPTMIDFFENDTINNHIILDYTLDLDLKQKNLFDFNISK